MFNRCDVFNSAVGVLSGELNFRKSTVIEEDGSLNSGYLLKNDVDRLSRDESVVMAIRRDFLGLEVNVTEMEGCAMESYEVDNGKIYIKSIDI